MFRWDDRYGILYYTKTVTRITHQYKFIVWKTLLQSFISKEKKGRLPYR